MWRLLSSLAERRKQWWGISHAWPHCRTADKAESVAAARVRDWRELVRMQPLMRQDSRGEFSRFEFVEGSTSLV